MDLKVGDVVRLKGGGPLMTVETLNPPEDDAYGADGKWVGTVWFHGLRYANGIEGRSQISEWDGPFHGVFSLESLEAGNADHH